MAGTPIKGTNVLGPVVPFSTEDIYAASYSKYQRGSKTVKDLTERDNIFLDRRENLMMVGVEDNSYNNSSSGIAFYIMDVNHSGSTSTSLMDNNNWIQFNLGSSDWTLPPPPASVYTGIKGQKSYDDRYYYICVETNIWKRNEIDWFIDSGTSAFGGDDNYVNVGEVPIWSSSGTWNYGLTVKDVDLVSSTSSLLVITFTDTHTKTIDLGDMFSSSSGHADGDIAIWDITTNTWIYDYGIKRLDITGGYLNLTYTDDNTTSFKVSDIDVLNELSDVTINSASSGDILSYNGSNWQNILFPGIKWTLPPPTTSSDIGIKGSMSYDDNFIYICTETDVWKRINVDFFVFGGSSSGNVTIDIGSVPVWDGNSYQSELVVSNIVSHTQGASVGELITYTDGTTSFISFGTSTSGTVVTNLEDLTDVNVSTNSTSGINNFLKWDGTFWVNSPISNSTISDNGITINNSIIELGGILTKNTTIDIDTYNLNIKTLSSGNIILNDLTYPKIDGSNGYVLTTNGSKVLTLQNPNNNIFIQTALLTLNGDGTNPLSETSLLSSTGLGSNIINANTLKVGDLIKFNCKGFINVTNTGVFTFNIKLGSIILSTRSSVTISNPKTNQLIDMCFEMVVWSIGASGKVMGSGQMLISVGTVATPTIAEFVMVNSATIDTTINQTLDFTVSWIAGFDGNINTTTLYIVKEKFI